jgi:hypothetical protein
LAGSETDRGEQLPAVVGWQHVRAIVGECLMKYREISMQLLPDGIANLIDDDIDIAVRIGAIREYAGSSRSQLCCWMLFLSALYRILPGMRISMRLQSLIGCAMLVLLLGLGVWVALQYVPVHWH